MSMPAARTAAVPVAGQTAKRTSRPTLLARDALRGPAARPPDVVEPLGLARVVLQLRVPTVQPGVDHEQQDDDGN
jgi:hypothetical protein